MADRSRSSSSHRSVWVEPIAPLTPRTIRCSAIDNLCAHVYPTPTYFFRLEPSQDVDTLFEYLCQGLSRVIYQQPHLAGILRQDDRGSFSVEIPEAPNAGTRFYFRDLSTNPDFPTFDQLQKGGFPFADGQEDGLCELAPDPFPASEAGDPVIIQQLSHVKGGLVLASSYTHLIGDLVQGIQIGYPWAEQTRSVIEAAVNCRPPPAVPKQVPDALMDRTRLSPTTDAPRDLAELRKKCEVLQNWMLIDPANPEATLAEMENLIPKAVLLANEQNQESGLRETTVGVWHVSLADRKALHQAVVKAAPNRLKLSSIDVMTAFVWRQIFRAKNVVGGRLDGRVMQSQSTLLYAGDVRPRLNPPLPRAYLGAAVDLFRVSLPASSFEDPMLAEDQSRALATIARAVRNSNSAWDSSQFNALLELSLHTPVSPGFFPRGPVDMLVTDHTRAAPLLTADWGIGLGKSVTFREPYLGRACPAAEVTMLPFHEDGSFEVMIAGEAITLDRLRADKEMQKWSTCKFVRHNVVDAAKATNARASKL